MRVAEIPIVFLSYDEPWADEFFADLIGKAPWAKRVHGVKGLDAVTGDEPTPEFEAVFTETCDRLMESLDDPMLNRIAMLKFEGHRNTEVAQEIGRTRRTVERKLEEIRRIWVTAGIIPAAAGE